MKIQFPWRKYQMIQACIDFYNLRLWEQFNNMDLFVVETPVEGPVIAGIMGAGGQEFGLEVFRGSDMFMQVQYYLDSKGDPSDKRIDTLGFSMCGYGDLGHYEKKWFKSCNFRAKNSQRVPIALCKRPNQQGGLIEDDRDIRLMLYVLKGLLKAYQEGDFDPRIIDDFKFLTLKVSGDEMDPAVKVVRKSYAAAKRLQKYYKCVGPFEGPDISELARLDRTWLIVPVYINILETKHQHCALCVADEHSKYLLSSDLIETEIGEVLDKLTKIFAGDNAAEQRGVPAKIIIAQRELYLELSQGLEDIGIEVQCMPNHPLAMEIRQDLGGLLSSNSKSGPALVNSFLSTSRSIIPADNDLAGWKKALVHMMAYFYDFWDAENKFRTVKVSKQFFGDGDWNYYLDQFESMSLPSYATWAALCYRPDKNDCTYAEELLGWEELSEPVRIALEALNNAWPSLYRVAATDQSAGTLVLEDLLLSQTVTIQDQKLSESATPDMIAPFWVYQVGRFYFVSGAGPCFGVLDINRVVNRLGKLKMPAPPTTEWLRQNAHVFGRLWKLYDEISLEGPQLPALQNTDGDPLEFITAVFSCENPASAKDALGRRTDMDYDEQEDLYVWFRGKLGEFMKNTLLGRVCFKDRTIEVEVNSRKRLERIRMILESVKGIRYQRHTTKDLQEEPSQGRKSPAALLKPEELPEDIRQAALGHVRRYYMEWLDMPIPALGNQSPRQAVKNPKTAQQVRILIKSMPDNIGNAGVVSVPREEMLKSLGLPE